MQGSIQQQSLQRKLLYTACILGLLASCYLLRKFVVEVKADELALREQNRGETELSGAFFRKALTGSRGLAVCGLWLGAIEKQKRNQWNELEMLIRFVTRLQPHLIRPWLHQSWNLAYNVSVECHDLRDMYFYITRGIELLTEGERQNRHHPELRYTIGMYLQHKICLSDNTNVMRSMLQLSSIDPRKRQRTRFYTEDERGNEEFNAEQFEIFCKENPQLVRRLHDGLPPKLLDPLNQRLHQRRLFLCATPEAVVRFLNDNQKIPSLFEDVEPGAPGAVGVASTPLRPFDKRFPLLPPPGEGRAIPPQIPFLDPDKLSYDAKIQDHHDAYLLARPWYCYAQEPLPRPASIPGMNEPIEDRTLQRNAPFTTLIFRDLPALSQNHHASRLQDEGWFEEKWLITKWFADRGNRFPSGGRAEVTTPPNATSRYAWEQSRLLWEEYGRITGLRLSRDELQQKEQRAQLVRRVYGANPGDFAPPLRGAHLDDPAMRESRDAHNYLSGYNRGLMLGSFARNYGATVAESQQETVAARKLHHDGLRHELAGRRQEAMESIDKGLRLWKEVLARNSDFAGDTTILEDTYDLNLKYVQLRDELAGKAHWRPQAVASYLGLALTRADGVPDWPWLARLESSFPHGVFPFKGEFDGVNADGKPLVPDGVKRTVYLRNPSLPMPEYLKPPAMEGMGGEGDTAVPLPPGR